MKANIELTNKHKIYLIKLSRLAFTDLDDFLVNDHDHLIAFCKYDDGIKKFIPRLNSHWLELTMFILPKLLFYEEHAEISKKLFNDYISDNVHPVENLFDIYLKHFL